ncbi:MAG: IclR family transcriptional regulator [Terriglobia bacterium]
MGKVDVYYIEVVGKALDVLEAFLHFSKRQLTLQEISQQLRLNKNAVFRILYTLTEHGYVLKEDQRYELGPKLLDLSNAKLRRSDLLTVAGPLLESLRSQLGETVNLGVLDDGQIRYIGVWESHHRFRLAERVGACDYLHSSALGKAHLAYLPSQEVRELLRKHGMPQQTEHTITTLSALKPELDATRARGYALDRQEGVLEGFCIAVPILNSDGSRPLAAISISGPQSRFTDNRKAAAIKALQEAAARIREKIGAAPPPAKEAEETPSAPSSKRQARFPRASPKPALSAPLVSSTPEV